MCRVLANRMIIDFVYGSYYGLHNVARTVAWTNYFRATDATRGHAPVSIACC
jgi:hypothetical protein